MTTGIRPVTDARKRPMMHPNAELLGEVDCGFASGRRLRGMVEALTVLRARDEAYLEAAASSASWAAARADAGLPRGMAVDRQAAMR
jgi:hypothetical protein